MQNILHPFFEKIQRDTGILDSLRLHFMLSTSQFMFYHGLQEIRKKMKEN